MTGRPEPVAIVALIVSAIVACVTDNNILGNDIGDTWELVISIVTVVCGTIIARSKVTPIANPAIVRRQLK